VWFGVIVGKNLTTRGRHTREECAEHISSLARALGRSLGPKDITLKRVRADLRQGHGGTGHLHGVEILILVGRQGRIQVGHQRGNSYLITSGIGGSEKVTDGFVYEVGAVPAIINLLFRNRNDGADFHLPTCSSLQFDCAVVAALPCLVVARSATDVRHLDSLCPMRVVIGV